MKINSDIEHESAQKEINRLCTEISRLQNLFDEIDLIVEGNLCDDDCDFCPINCECDWRKIQDITKKRMKNDR